MKHDTAFQEKLKSAMESYTGEQTEAAVFEGVLVGGGMGHYECFGEGD